MKKYFISFLLICSYSAFGAKYEHSYTHAQVARFEPSSCVPDSTFEFGFTNFHAPLSHNGQTIQFSEELSRANDLFYTGDKQGLVKLHESLTSFGSKFSFRAREYKQQAQYVDSLINSKYLESFQRLNQAPPSEIKQVLREIMAMNPDPMTKAEAMIAADKMVGDIFCSYGAEFTIEPTGHEATDMMVTTRIGSYQVEKLLPAKGTVPDKAMMQDFTDGVMRVAQQMPQDLQEGFVKSSIQQFVESAFDPVRITKENLTIAKEVAVTLFDTIIGYHIRSEEYGRQRTEQISKYAKAIDIAFKNYNSKDWGRLAGETAVRVAHCYGYYKLGQVVVNRVAGTLDGAGTSRAVLAIETSQVQAPATMESVLAKMVKDEIKGLNTMYKSPFEKGYEGVVKLFEALRPSNVKQIIVEVDGIKGPGLVGFLKDDIKVVARSISRDGAPTLEFQIPHPGGSNFIYNKVRF